MLRLLSMVLWLPLLLQLLCCQRCYGLNCCCNDGVTAAVDVPIVVDSICNCCPCCYCLHCFCQWCFFFKKVGHSRPLFLYFRLFNTVDNKQMFNKILPMTGVELRTSGIESNRPTNWATTTSQSTQFVVKYFNWSSRHYPYKVRTEFEIFTTPIFDLDENKITFVIE